MAGASRPETVQDKVSDPLEPRLLPTLIGEIGRPSYANSKPTAQVYSCILSENGQATPVVQIIVSFPKTDRRQDEWMFIPYHDGSLVRVVQRAQRTKGDSFFATSIELILNCHVAAENILKGVDKIKNRKDDLAKLIKESAVNAARASILSTVSRDGHYVTRKELLSAWGTSIVKDVMES